MLLLLGRVQIGYAICSRAHAYAWRAEHDSPLWWRLCTFKFTYRCFAAHMSYSRFPSLTSEMNVGRSDEGFLTASSPPANDATMRVLCHALEARAHAGVVIKFYSEKLFIMKLRYYEVMLLLLSSRCSEWRKAFLCLETKQDVGLCWRLQFAFIF